MNRPRRLHLASVLVGLLSIVHSDSALGVEFAPKLDPQAHEAELTKPIYAFAALEEARLFEVVDSLVERFLAGVLPFGRGAADDELYDAMRNGEDRLDERERSELYQRKLGAADQIALMGALLAVDPQGEELPWLRFDVLLGAYLKAHPELDTRQCQQLLDAFETFDSSKLESPLGTLGEADLYILFSLALLDDEEASDEEEEAESKP